MKISLIEARPAHCNAFEKFVIPRLGLPIMGAMLKAEGHDVRIFVHQLDGLWQHSLDIAKSDLVGISTLTPSAPEAYELARWIRRANRIRGHKIKVVLGGPHVTFLADEGLDNADYVVRGEGEHTIVELVRALEGEGSYADIKGLSWWDEEGKKCHNPDRPLEENLDEFPFADLTLLQGHEKLRHLPIATSRGCPHDCDFCSVVSMFGRGYRRRSNELVVRALEEQVLPLGSRIFFVDDNFAGRRGEAKKLLTMIKQRGLSRRMRWYTQVTVHAARDDELLDLMRETNCHQVYVGLESVNPESLKDYNKAQTVEQISDCIKRFHRKGIRVHGMFVLGSDHDDTHTVEATVEFARKHDLNTVQFAVLTPMPGTHTYAHVADRIFTHDWGLYDGFHVVHEPARMNMYELQKASLDAWKHFYTVPSYMNAFMQLKMHTGFLRYYGRRLVKRAYHELDEYLSKLQPLATKLDTP